VLTDCLQSVYIEFTECLWSVNGILFNINCANQPPLSSLYRYLLKALDMYWHEDCLKCGCCDCRLGEVGSTLYTKGNLLLCKRDYLR
jgi:hypothetical protein